MEAAGNTLVYRQVPEKARQRGATCVISKAVFNDDEVVIQIHPRERDYVNIHNNCLHLWRPIDKELPLPPLNFV